MKITDQDTDWNYSTGSSSGLPYHLNRETKLYTSGSMSSLGDIEFSSSLTKPDVISKAKSLLTKIDNEPLRNSAEHLLIIIQSLLENYFDVSVFPPLKAYESEDGSIIFEWVFPHFRVGFSIEQDKSESGWFLVSDDSAGNILASGEILGGIGTEGIVFWLLQYISLNY